MVTPPSSGSSAYSGAVAASAASALAQRLGIRTGRVAAPVGLLVMFAGTLLFLLPPHSTIAAIVLCLAGVVVYALGVLQIARGPWWALIIGALSGLLLCTALIVAGRGLALRLFGEAVSCQVVDRRQVDTSARYKHHDFVHTLGCPAAGSLSIRTDSTDRQPPGAPVEILLDPDGVLEPDFAGRHLLPVDVVMIVVALGAVAATITVARRRSHE